MGDNDLICGGSLELPDSSVEEEAWSCDLEYPASFPEEASEQASFPPVHNTYETQEEGGVENASLGEINGAKKSSRLFLSQALKVNGEDSNAELIHLGRSLKDPNFLPLVRYPDLKDPKVIHLETYTGTPRQIKAMCGISDAVVSGGAFRNPVYNTDLEMISLHQAKPVLVSVRYGMVFGPPRYELTPLEEVSLLADTGHFGSSWEFGYELDEDGVVMDLGELYMETLDLELGVRIKDLKSWLGVGVGAGGIAVVSGLGAAGYTTLAAGGAAVLGGLGIAGAYEASDALSSTYWGGQGDIDLAEEHYRSFDPERSNELIVSGTVAQGRAGGGYGDLAFKFAATLGVGRLLSVPAGNAGRAYSARVNARAEAGARNLYQRDLELRLEEMPKYRLPEDAALRANQDSSGGPSKNSFVLGRGGTRGGDNTGGGDTFYASSGTQTGAPSTAVAPHSVTEPMLPYSPTLGLIDFFGGRQNLLGLDALLGRPSAYAHGGLPGVPAIAPPPFIEPNLDTGRKYEDPRVFKPAFAPGLERSAMMDPREFADMEDPTPLQDYSLPSQRDPNDIAVFPGGDSDVLYEFSSGRRGPAVAGDDQALENIAESQAVQKLKEAYDDRPIAVDLFNAIRAYGKTEKARLIKEIKAAKDHDAVKELMKKEGLEEVGGTAEKDYSEGLLEATAIRMLHEAYENNPNVDRLVQAIKESEMVDQIKLFRQIAAAESPSEVIEVFTAAHPVAAAVMAPKVTSSEPAPVSGEAKKEVTAAAKLEPPKALDLKRLPSIAKTSPVRDSLLEADALYQRVYEEPHLLIGSVEMGPLKFQIQLPGGKTHTTHIWNTDKKAKATANMKVGGLASVANDMVNALPGYLKSRFGEGGKVSFVTMLPRGVDRTHLGKAKEMEITTNGKVEKVFVYEVEVAENAHIYFVDHPLFDRLTIFKGDKDRHERMRMEDGSMPERDLYSTDPRKDEELLYEGQSHWDGLHIYSLFMQSIAKISDQIGANIYEGQDFHAGAAPLWMKNPVVTTTKVHNALAGGMDGGPGYQGTYWAFGGGDGKYRRTLHPGTDQQREIPWVRLRLMRQQMRILNLQEIGGLDTYLRYFELNGGINLMQAALKLSRDTGFMAGHPVSKGFAESIARTKEERIARIEAQYEEVAGIEDPYIEAVKSAEEGARKVYTEEQAIENGMSKEEAQRIYWRNHVWATGGLLVFRDKLPLEGIANGLNNQVHASRDKRLKKDFKTDKLEPFMDDTELIEALGREDGLRFAHDLETVEGRRAALAAKANIKRLVVKQVFKDKDGKPIEPDPKKPLFVFGTRIADQKWLEPLIRNIEHIIRNGGQIIIAGPISDDTAKGWEKSLKPLASEHPENFWFYPEFTGELPLLMSAADFFVVTSTSEPFGLVSPEAASKLAIVLGREVDGEGKSKIKSGDFYQFDNGRLDPKGDAMALRELLNKWIALYKNPQVNGNELNLIESRMVQAGKESFPWDKQLGQFMANFRTSALYRTIYVLNEAVAEGTLNIRTAKVIARRRMESAAQADRENLIRWMQRESEKTLHELDQYILKTFGG